jgi:hypothetical protein
MTWLRRLFRRCPPHLRGRVPVDGTALSSERGPVTPSGVSFAGLYGIRPEDYRERWAAKTLEDTAPAPWSPPPDAVGRAFLKSVPPTALGRAVQKAQAAWSRSERVAWVTPEEYEAACYSVVGNQRFVPGFGNVLLLLGVRLEVLTPEDIERGRCKPSPADNARRYTSEEGTW